ncbi:hypothetical protein CTAYLR_005531 [Chrysophaeum taylorii]|uniref:3-dehydroquinate synthase domain-containing protein n=1 Tax=Chrysophaeum taylorii TaxID=2483200 RepID=A0AAD7U6L1_9STRA|nr:hypothetical protein CTAYLR_005531 [Chrysophaeum taylorii]
MLWLVPWAVGAFQSPSPVQFRAGLRMLAVSEELEALRSSMEVALEDKRRVDEIVGKFSYSGSLFVGEREFKGQGAVKRGLSKLLFEEPCVGVRVVEERLVVDKASGAVDVEVELDEAGAVTSMWTGAVVEEEEEEEELKKEGPKWETDDGRVVQKIWQERDLLAPGKLFLKEKLELGSRLVAIVDSTVWELYGQKLEAWCESVGVSLEAIVAPGNEDEKTMENMLFMLDELARVDPLRRSEPVLAIGGGVLTDTAGFACALWRRGIPWCRMPTTLLGMVDASVGIKVAVNYHRKNGVGHFFSPLHTFIDDSFLGTLSLADVRSGCGEIMKAALVHDGALFDLMEEHGAALIDERFQEGEHAAEIIKRSVDTMLECIGPDLWEESLLRPMDFGHTFSRTLEACQSFKLRHGEAVAIDCVMSTMIAHVKGLVSDAQAKRVLDLYAKLQLPCSIKGITADTYKRATREITVHRDGILRAPLPNGIGACAFVDDFSDAEIEVAFSNLETFMADHPDTYWDRSKSFDPGMVRRQQSPQNHQILEPVPQ